MAAWKAVFAYKWWWLTETVIEWITGEFFYHKNGKDFIEIFLTFDMNNWKWYYTPENCTKQAEKFSEDIFEKQFKKFIK